MSATNYTEYNVGNHIFCGVDFPAPTALYVGLLNTGYNTDSLESGIVDNEVVSNSYSRVMTQCNTSDWTNYTGLVVNKNILTFSFVTSEAWGAISGVFISDSATGNNVLFYTSISEQTINLYDMYQIPATGLRIIIT